MTQKPYKQVGNNLRPAAELTLSANLKKKRGHHTPVRLTGCRVHFRWDMERTLAGANASLEKEKGHHCY